MSIKLGTETVQEYLTVVSYNAGTADLSNYYNKQEVEDLIFNIDIGDKLEPYALKTEIPSLTGYATQEWVNSQGFIKEGQSTGYATEEYVNTKLANLVNAAPETLDTLGELATALQENKTVVSALNSSISNKANKSEVYSIDEIEEKDFADKLYVREYVAQELGALDTLLDEIIGG